MKQKELIKKIKKLQRYAGWATLPAILFPFFDNNLPLYWFLLSLGVWFFCLGLKGYLEKQIGGFVVAQDVELKGKTAQGIAILAMILALTLLILPGLLGLIQSIT